MKSSQTLHGSLSHYLTKFHTFKVCFLPTYQGFWGFSEIVQATGWRGCFQAYCHGNGHGHRQEPLHFCGVLRRNSAMQRIGTALEPTKCRATRRSRFQKSMHSCGGSFFYTCQKSLPTMKHPSQRLENMGIANTFWPQPPAPSTETCRNLCVCVLPATNPLKNPAILNHKKENPHKPHDIPECSPVFHESLRISIAEHSRRRHVTHAATPSTFPSSKGLGAEVIHQSSKNAR